MIEALIETSIVIVKFISVTAALSIFLYGLKNYMENIMSSWHSIKTNTNNPRAKEDNQSTSSLLAVSIIALVVIIRWVL